MDNVTFYGEIEGISLEQMVRYRKFDMRVKHFHDQYEIFYIIEGGRVFFFNNREYVANAGDLILVDSNLIHMRNGGRSESAQTKKAPLILISDVFSTEMLFVLSRRFTPAADRNFYFSAEISTLLALSQAFVIAPRRSP